MAGKSVTIKISPELGDKMEEFKAKYYLKYRKKISNQTLFTMACREYMEREIKNLNSKK